MPHNTNPRRPNAFTLTELLIVLAVLGILAALLFPVFASARRHAQDAACIANLQQLSHAMTMYVSDYDGAYPLTAEGVIYNNTVTTGTRLWSDLVKPYTKGSSLSCPLCDWQNAPGIPYWTGYVINGRLNRMVGSRQQHTVDGRHETVVTYPSCTIILADARIGEISGSRPDTATTRAGLEQYFHHPISDTSSENILAQEPAGTRHHKGADYAFADGHAKWLLPNDVRTDRKSNGIVPGFGL